jgi:hypothetical protein
MPARPPAPKSILVTFGGQTNWRPGQIRFDLIPFSGRHDRFGAGNVYKRKGPAPVVGGVTYTSTIWDTSGHAQGTYAMQLIATHAQKGRVTWMLTYRNGKWTDQRGSPFIIKTQFS